MFKGALFILGIGIIVLCAVAFAGFEEKEVPYSDSGVEIYSPGNWISKEQIKIYNNSVLLKIENATIAEFTDTNSMDPVIDEDSNSIEIKPTKDLKIGDIISYKTGNKKIIHRIVDISEDEEGIYYILKGDNNQFADKEKVRFEQISGVVVGILY